MFTDHVSETHFENRPDSFMSDSASVWIFFNRITTSSGTVPRFHKQYCGGCTWERLNEGVSGRPSDMCHTWTRNAIICPFSRDVSGGMVLL